MFKKEIDSLTLFSIFRIIFGVFMIREIIGLFPFVYDLQNSHLVLHYPNLEFINAYSIALIDSLKYTSLFGSVLLVYGKYIRTGALLFLIGFGYIFLIDMSFYNNHYYLWCLFAFLFIVTDSHFSYTLKELFTGVKRKENSSLLAVQSFKILVSIVYFYAAIAKMNADWFQGYPLIIWMENKGFSNPILLGKFLSYGGLFFDLLVPVFLWFFPRKWWLIIIYFTFHISNYFLFNIGIFPFMMIACLLLFWNVNNDFSIFKNNLTASVALKIKTSIVILFIIFNLIFPLRFLLVEGNVAWHKQGYFFSWRMMLNHYETYNVDFLVKLPNQNQSYLVNFEELVTFRQFVKFNNDPYSIWYIAQVLKKDALKKYNEPNAEVYYNAEIVLNNHEKKHLVKQKEDLTKFNYYIHKINKFINYEK